MKNSRPNFLALFLLAAGTITTAMASPLLQADDSRFANLKGNPGLRSASAIVLDAQGNLIYGKDVNTVRPIASITKVMTAMVTLDAKLDLNEKITITKEDRDLIRLTGSRLEYGAQLNRRDLIQLALMSSENRAATALGRTFPGGMGSFVAAMNRKAASIGMANSRFADPAGLKSENVSTANDLAKMIAAAETYPLIEEFTTATRKEVSPYARRGPITYGNTNRLLKNKSWDIELSKTGYINEAGRCLVMQANIEGEEVSIVLLNSFGKLTPFGDSNRLRKWMLASS
jgi:D-alanyl-D-alanine endopeptidase (penicillin-binding protein 7)